MWFRQRSQQSENDRLRASNQRNRQRKSSSKIPRTVVNGDTKDATAQQCNAITVTVTPSRSRSDCSTLVGAQSRRRMSLLSDEDNDIDENGKEKDKALRTEQKYKKSRITKSTSRTKIPDSRPVNQQIFDNTAKSPTKTGKRRNTNLNLNALLRYKSFISGSTKKLTSEDFDRMRRKSLGETNKCRRKSSGDNILNKSTNESKNENCSKSLNLNELQLSTASSSTPLQSPSQSFDTDTDDCTNSKSLNASQSMNYTRKPSPSLFSKWSDGIHSSRKAKSHKKGFYFLFLKRKF